MAKRMEDAGVAAITVHGRTREQYYSGQADWDVIAEVKNAVSIPVIGNGDVVDGPSAKKMIDHTGVDGIAVARAARGNPWIFREILHFLETGEELPKPSWEEKKEMIRRHGEALVEYKGEFTAIREMRKQVAWYTTGMPNSAKLRGQINEIETLDGLYELLDRL